MSLNHQRTDASYLYPHWPVPTSVHALVTTRLGGVSTGDFCAFNLATHCGDDPAAVTANRKKLMDDQQLESIQWLHQNHGCGVYQVVDTVRETPVQADALWTRCRDIGCAVLTADCLSVFVYSPCGPAVGVAHAGWRGLTSGVLQALVRAMPGAPESMSCWLGPAIGADLYEVGEEVRAAFIAGNGAAAADVYFRPAQVTGRNHWYADLRGMARFILAGMGLAVFSETEELCTWGDSRFYSYRQAAHRSAGMIEQTPSDTGRMASLIWMD